MIIKRTADNCDSDGEFKDEILPVDLTELMGLNPIPEDIVFTVSNASKIPGDGNADTVNGGVFSNSVNKVGDKYLPGLPVIIKGCIEGNNKCYEILYKSYYGYIMGIALRYVI